MVLPRWYAQRTSTGTAVRFITTSIVANVQTDVSRSLQYHHSKRADTIPVHSYTEAIDILYTQNKFVVRQCKTIVDLERTILPHRLHAIRYLHIDVPLDFPVDKDELAWPVYPPDPYHSMWVPACRTLARMQGLQHLRITVSDIMAQHRFQRQSNPDDMFVQLLESLIEVKALVFEVYLDAPIDTSYVLGRLGAVPFSLIIRQ